MKIFLIGLSMICSSAFAADTMWTCTPDSTNTNDGCKVVMDVTANQEIIVVEYNGGIIEYCNGSWVQQGLGCSTTGTKRILNGELTSGQLIGSGFKLYSKINSDKNNLWVCRLN